MKSCLLHVCPFVPARESNPELTIQEFYIKKYHGDAHTSAHQNMAKVSQAEPENPVIMTDLLNTKDQLIDALQKRIEHLETELSKYTST